MTRCDEDLILFTYDISVFGRRMDWYLKLRNFKYYHCIQPNRMPRPDLAALGIKHRRIPMLAIGRDIYIDTRLIIQKLEMLFPAQALGSNKPFEQGMERVLQNWLIDGGLFWKTSALIPTSIDVMVDRQWTDDRTEMVGREFSREKLDQARPEALAHIRKAFETMEHCFLADGREYILDTPEPTLADVHSIWTFDWALQESMDMFKNLEQDVISEEIFPKTFAWVYRFREAVKKAEQRNGPPHVLSSEKAIGKILDGNFFEKEGGVDELDPLKLKKGQLVDVFPIDTGSNHKDRGRLVALGSREVVIASDVRDGEGVLRLHFPRTNFRILPVREETNGDEAAKV